MSKYTRGEFLGLAGLAAGAIVGGGRTDAAQPDEKSNEAELAVVNAKVFTVDDARPRAEAFAVRGGRFMAVGSTADIRNLVTARTTVIDAAGATVTPGFIDAHSHPSGLDELFGVNGNVRTLRELQDALVRKAATAPPEQWVTAFMFDDTKFDVVLTRRQLDEVVPGSPGRRAPPRRPHQLVQLARRSSWRGIDKEHAAIRRGDSSCATIAAS